MNNCFDITYTEVSPIEVFYNELCPIGEQMYLITDTNHIIVTESGNYVVLDDDNNICFESLSQIDYLLHKIEYSSLDYEYAKEFFKGKAPVNIGGCSSIRCGNFFGRNLDWFEPENGNQGQPDFFVTTAADGQRHKVWGIASVQGINESIAVNHYNTYLWRVLPFYLQDGKNDAGVFCNINVVPTDKGINTYTIPQVEKREEICSLMLVRYILDHFSSALQACEYIRDYVSVYMPVGLTEMNYESHYMVGDANSTYVLEIVENHIVFYEHNIMTNFHIDGVEFLPDGKVYTNADATDGNLPTSLGITPYGSGLERYNILVDAQPTTLEEMRVVMNTILYSKAYDLDVEPYWYSEFVNQDYEVTVDSLPTDENMEYVINAAQEIKHGEREGRLWMTTHSVVYDLVNDVIDIVSFERINKEYIINLK